MTTASNPYQASGLSSWFDVVKEEFEHGFDMWKKTVTFKYTFDTWVDDVAECGKIWIKGVTPFFGGAFAIPTFDPTQDLVFVVDAAAESADAKAVVITGVVDKQLPLVGQLVQIGTGTDYSDRVRVDRDGLWLKVSLQNLTTMQPGHSAGVVYVNEQGGSKRVLAHLYVVKLA